MQIVGTSKFQGFFVKRFIFFKGFLSVAAPKPKIPSVEFDQYKDRPFKCQNCPAAFTRLVHLKRHSLIHTGDKKFKCDYCPKTFYTSYALKEHVNFHKGIKNYACSVCNKKFMTNTILKRHFIMHTNQKPYVCPYCKKRFKSVTLCRRHINVHKRDVNLHVQGGEKEGLLEDENKLEDISEEPSKIIDFTDAFSDNVFNIPGIINGNDPINVNLMVEESVIDRTANENINKESSDTLNILAESVGKENETYLPTGSEFEEVLRNGNSETLADNVETNGDQNLYSTIYVNYENLQVLIPNDFGSLLSQMKLENNDSLFLNNLQESNIFLSLTQGSGFTTENQQFDAFNSNLMLSTINDLTVPETDKDSDQILPNILQNECLDNPNLDGQVLESQILVNQVLENQVLETADLQNQLLQSQALKQQVIQNKFLQNQVLQNEALQNQVVQNEVLTNGKDTDKSLLIDASLVDSLVILNDPKSDLNFAQNVAFSLPNEPAKFTCQTCNLLFKTFVDMQKHKCASLRTASTDLLAIDTNSESTTQSTKQDTFKSKVSTSKLIYNYVALQEICMSFS